MNDQFHLLLLLLQDQSLILHDQYHFNFYFQMTRDLVFMLHLSRLPSYGDGNEVLDMDNQGKYDVNSFFAILVLWENDKAQKC